LGFKFVKGRRIPKLKEEEDGKLVQEEVTSSIVNTIFDANRTEVRIRDESFGEQGV
jgi:hypothetical protein